MKNKLNYLLLLFVSAISFAQNPTRFPAGVQITGGLPTETNPTYLGTVGASGVLGQTDSNLWAKKTYVDAADALKADKTNGATQITDPNAHSNLSTSANATQSAINTAIDTQVGVNAANITLKENSANKQNSLTVDGSGVKFPTVDAVNTKFETRIAVNDANYTITGTNNQLIAYTNLTTTRTVNLPAATTANQRIWITDESGLASSARAISVVPNGSDTVSGGTNTVVNFPNGSGYFESNGAGKWNIISTTSVQFSAGVNTLPSITDLGTGSVTLGSGVYSLFANTTGVGRPKAFVIAGSTFALADQMTTFITAQYDTTTGTVSLVATTVESTINYTTVIPICKIFRDGLVLHISDYDSLGVALSNKLQKSWEKTQQYRFEPGGVLLGESATRIITVTSGTTWRGAVEMPLTAVASNVQTCYQFVNTSGTWSKSVITQYNNTQWNDTAGLVTLSGGRYGVSFVYRSIGNDTDIAVVLGTGDYNLGQAQTSSPPTNLPTFITSHMVLVGRIIVAKSATTATQIDSANTTGVIFTSAGVTDHNALMNLQTAQTGVTYGHITDASQTIAGDKTFTGVISAPTATAGTSTTQLATTAFVSTAIAGGLTGSGTTSTIPKFTSSNVLGNSNITDSGSLVTLNSTTNVTGSLGVGTSAPTHALTLGSIAASTGAVLYITSDQTTNYERLKLSQGSNIFQLVSENGGTGVVRDLNIGTGNSIRLKFSNTASMSGYFTSSFATAASNASIFGIANTLSTTGGVQNAISILPTISQTTTAGYRGLWIAPFENTLGSGSKLLIDAGNTSAAAGGGTYTSKFTVDSSGNSYTLGRALFGTTTDNGVDVGQFNGTVSGSPATLSNQFVTKAQSDLKAPINSPSLTGTPAAPTATAGTNTTQIATTAFVTSAISAGTHNPVTLGTTNGLALSTQVLSLGLASTSTNGALSSTDWNTFNGKQNSLGYTPVNQTTTISTTAPLTGGGDLSANRTLGITQATTSTNGYLSSTDWNTFNGKATDSNVLHKTGNESFTGTKSSTITSNPAISIENNGGANAIDIHNANSGYGVYVNTDTGGIGAALVTTFGTNIYASNASANDNIHSQLFSSGDGFVSDCNATATGALYIGKNNSVETFRVSKTGNVTGNSFIKSGGTSSQYLMADGSTSVKYKVYSALLTGGTGATVLENTLGGSVTISNGTTGVYQFTTSGLFTSSKTMPQFTVGNATTGITYNIFRIDANTVQLNMYDGSGAGNYIDNSTIEIRVYN